MRVMKSRSYKKQRRDGRGIFLPALLFLFLFPYIISNFNTTEKQTLKVQETPGEILVLQKKIWGTVKIPLEEYLEGMLAATIPAEYHMETLKAQVVLLRTYCVKQAENKDGDKIIWDEGIKELYFTNQECEKLWKDKTVEQKEKIKKAVRETKGMIVVSEEDIPQLPFFRLSNGRTRDITEYVVRTKEFECLKTVVCEEDLKAEEYVQYVELSVNEFQKSIWKILGKKESLLDKLTLYRDSAEYVKEIEIGEDKIDGELFRQTFGLVSSCFYLEKINDKIQMKTKGIGHGFGFSQYSANKLAEGGKNYEELLNYFFQNIRFEKI